MTDAALPYYYKPISSPVQAYNAKEGNCIARATYLHTLVATCFKRSGIAIERVFKNADGTESYSSIHAYNHVNFKFDGNRPRIIEYDIDERASWFVDPERGYDTQYSTAKIAKQRLTSAYWEAAEPKIQMVRSDESGLYDSNGCTPTKKRYVLLLPRTASNDLVAAVTYGERNDAGRLLSRAMRNQLPPVTTDDILSKLSSRPI